ncbi:unnamed protein product [Haemonchus placei]|uniref:Retrotransposon protein, putative, unclassified n=1 Tax=Haemonchus placei TaxID=6290 RepID=A0A0N4W1Z4_HAEPC|nr:unnamed protein product [Haemonchus placei]
MGGVQGSGTVSERERHKDGGQVRARKVRLANAAGLLHPLDNARWGRRTRKNDGGERSGRRHDDGERDDDDVLSRLMAAAAATTEAGRRAETTGAGGWPAGWLADWLTGWLRGRADGVLWMHSLCYGPALPRSNPSCTCA